MLTTDVTPLPDVRSAALLSGKRVLVRADLDAPLEGGRVTNDFRLRALLPTLHYLRDVRARTVVVGHTGRDPHETLASIHKTLNELFPLTFVRDVAGPDAERALQKLAEGETLMLENLRQHPGEVGNDPEFARRLASFADAYVNEAFANSHREHASMVGVPKLLPRYAGARLIEEVTELARALKPPHPAVFVLGGKKFATKEPLIRKFLDVYDAVCVGGALANDFFKARDWEVGESLLSSGASRVDELLGHPNLVLPVDVVVRTENGEKAARQADAVLKGDCILDIGPRTVELIAERARSATTVLWNGPVGDFEHGFDKGTLGTAKALAELAPGRSVVVGGGDTIAAITRLGFTESDYSFVSTGGGSMLKFLANETLPALKALRA